MTPEDRRARYAEAFYDQARSDWSVYQLLESVARESVPRCHPLHYPQLSTEKLAKAYRIRDLAADVDKLARHHTGFSEFINQFLNSKVLRQE